MDIIAVLVLILLIIVAYLIFSLPLFLGLLVMGRPHPVLKVGLVNLLALIINAAVLALFGRFIEGFGLIVTTIITVLFYREMFHIKAWKAFIVYVLQIVFSAVIYLIALAAGISFAALGFLSFV